jgi:hypothetical protein
VPVDDEHGHPRFAYFSDLDLSNVAPELAKPGIGKGNVDNNGQIRSVIDGPDVIVGQLVAQQVMARSDARAGPALPSRTRRP